MSTTFPTTVDSFTDPLASDTLNSVTVPHHSQHANVNDAVLAVERAILGVRNDLAVSKLVPGATSWSLRNNADSADNLIITNAGNATLRGTLAANTAVFTAPSTFGGGGGTSTGWFKLATTLAGTNATDGKTAIHDLIFSGLTGDYAGVIAAFDGATTTDTGAYNYTGKLRGVMGHVLIQSVGATIAKTESGAFVTITNAGSTGTLTDAYCLSGELLHNGGVTITGIRGTQGTLTISGSGNIGSGIGIQGLLLTTAGQTGTFTTTAVGSQAIVQHNSAGAVNRATGTQSYVDLVGTGTVSTNAVGVQAYVQSASTSAVTTNVVGLDAWVAWGSSNAQNAVYAGQFQYMNTGGATLANAEGIHILGPTISGGTVTKGRGIRIANQGNANVTTCEALHIDNQTGSGTNISITTLGGLHQFGASANIGSAFTLSDLTTTLYNVDTRNTSGGLAGTHQFVPVVATITSGAGTVFTSIAAKAYTLTLTGGAGVSVLSGLQILVSQPTVTSASATAVTGLSSVSISGPPILGGSVTTPAGGATSLWVGSAIATVAGGALASGIGIGLTSNAPTVGIYWGSGAPTIAAPKGSVYIRTDGTGTTDRAYVNTNASTTWTALTTVA